MGQTCLQRGSCRLRRIGRTVNIDDQSIDGAVGVLDFQKRGTRLGRHHLGRSPVVPGQQDHLLLGNSADGSDHGLDGISPLVDVGNIVRLHQTATSVSF